MLSCQAYYRVDERAERRQKEGAVTWEENMALEYIDVEATHVQETTDGEATSGSKKPSTEGASGNKGMNFVFRSYDDNKK
jgi:hypothetical protein